MAGLGIDTGVGREGPLGREAAGGSRLADLPAGWSQGNDSAVGTAESDVIIASVFREPEPNPFAGCPRRLSVASPSAGRRHYRGVSSSPRTAGRCNEVDHSRPGAATGLTTPERRKGFSPYPVPVPVPARLK